MQDYSHLVVPLFAIVVIGFVFLKDALRLAKRLLRRTAVKAGEALVAASKMTPITVAVRVRGKGGYVPPKFLQDSNTPTEPPEAP
jgi:hypothetical protein